MQHLRVYVIFGMMLAISATRYDRTPRTNLEHKINKREDVVNKHHRDPGKTFGSAGKLHPIPETMANTTRLLDVKALEARSRTMKNQTQHRNYHGYLNLVPPNQFMHRNYNVRSQRLYPRDGRNRVRYYNARPRTQRSKKPSDLASSLSRWFFSDDSEESEEVRPSKIHQRQSSYRPSSYQNYPPYWSSGSASGSGTVGGNQKFNSFTRFQKSRAVNHRPVTNNKINFVKSECNSCNSVPWTPILKPSAVHQPFGDSQSYGVPTIEVHHDTSGYATNHQQNIVPAPAPVIEHTPDSTIPASYGLPLGNIPTAHGLLPPINHVKIHPTGLVPPPPTVLNPVPTDGLIQSIQFPELSPIPVVPIHDSNQFLQVETSDLVPPIPPQKSVSNVVFTISENGPGHTDSVIDNHIGQTDHGHGSDQHTDSSSFVNSHFSHLGPFNPYNPTNNHVNLDIVKSVPVAEYTSSIEYPLQIIQSPQYIDIAALPNVTKAGTSTYEKEPQTGSQKISDILFGLVKDTNPKQSFDVQTSGAKITEHSAQHSEVKQTNHYLPTKAPPAPEVQKTTFIESGPVYPSNLIYNQQQNSVWSDHSAVNAQPFIAQPHQPKLESESDGLLPDPTSTSWLLPAQSNLEPQWILPVSNPPVIPYPLLPEEGIASAVNEELSPSPQPAPMNDAKTKKIQIIIPYTSGDTKKDFDQNILESAHQEIYKTSAQEDTSQESLSNQGGTKHHQTRKVPGQQIATFSVPSNATQNPKFINDVHHILALNIKELLKDEVENPKTEQNMRLQKNIDNWTALEYSNHKTVAKKEPQEVISFANAVTSIPGTSISHLLLTSKKIPDKYLTTTPLPVYDEPATTPFAGTSSVSVESKPFTAKTYDTSALYSTVTRIAPTTTTLKTIIKDVLKENKNHRNGYAEVVKTKANQWGKLNENLVLPENVSNKSSTPLWSDKKSSFDEKVYVVTPVSVWQSSSSDVNKRTTRQVFMTEKPEMENGTISPEATKSYITKLFGNKTERAKISKFNKPKPIQKFFATTKPPPRNITKIQIQKEIPLTKLEVDHDVRTFNDTDKKSINDVFPFRNGGELPLELAIANTTSKESLANEVRKGSAKEVKNSKDFRRTKAHNSTEEVLSAESSNITSLDTTTVPIPENSTESVNLKDGGYGLKVKSEQKNSKNRPISSFDDSSKNKTVNHPSNLPPGIFGETKRVEIKKGEQSSDLTSINETIKLLKEYLQETSDELQQQKTEGTENFKEEDRP